MAHLERTHTQVTFKNHTYLATRVVRHSNVSLTVDPPFLVQTEISKKMLDASPLTVVQTFWAPRGNDLGDSLMFLLVPPCWADNHEIWHKRSFSLQEEGQ